jgi:hypothetical protein
MLSSLELVAGRSVIDGHVGSASGPVDISDRTVPTDAARAFPRMSGSTRSCTVGHMRASSSMSEAGALRIVLAVALTVAVALAIGATLSVAAGIAVVVVAVIAGFAFETRHMKF